MNNLAGIHDDLEEYQRALELDEKALAIYREVLGVKHPDTVRAVINLAYTLVKQKRHHDADTLVEEYLGILSKDHLLLRRTE